MAHEGFLRLDGSEVINAARTHRYAKNLVPQLSLTDCSPCTNIETVLNRPATARSLETILEDSQYRTPLLDTPHPEWFDPDDTDSWEFVGAYPLSVEGLDNSTTSAEVTQTSGDGGWVSRPRRTTREVRVTALLVGLTDRATQVGMRWLDNVLSRGQRGGCTPSTLDFFSACPDLRPELVPNPVGRFSASNAAGWTASPGATLSATGAFTGSTGTSLSFSTADVDGEASMSVAFAQPSRLPLRRNLVTNPSYRAATGQSHDVRINSAFNPSGNVSLAGWAPYGLSPASGYPVERVGDTAAIQTAPVNGLDSAVRVRASTGTSPLSGTGLSLGSASRSAFFIENGRYVTISAYVAATSISQVRLGVTFYYGVSTPGAISTTYGPTVTATTNLQRTYLNVEVPILPIPADFAVIHVTTTDAGGWTTTKDITVGGVLVEYGESTATPGPYFDGSTTGAPEGWGYRWTGAQGNSESALSAPETVGNFRAIDRTKGGRLAGQSYLAIISGNPVGVDIATTFPAFESVAVGSRYSGSVKVGNATGSPVTVKLELRAGGVVAISPDVVVPASGFATVTATSNAAVSSASPIYAALKTTNGVGYATIEIDDLLIEKVSSAVGPGPYFDGATEDTAAAVHEWEGAPDASTSAVYEPFDPAAYANVRLEAVVGGVVVGSVESGIVNSPVSLTVDAPGGAPLAWKITSLDGKPFDIDKVEWSLIADVEALDALATNWAGLEGFASEIPEDPIGDALDLEAANYIRSLRQVTCISGPTVVQTFASCAASLAKVEFTLVAGRPFRYSQEIAVGKASIGSLPVEGQTGFIINDPIPYCPDEFDTGPAVDPSCPVIPPPPKPPMIATVCNSSSGPVLRRIGLYIPPGVVPSAATILPILDIKTATVLKQLNIRFFPAPGGSVDLATLDPCSSCAEFAINHVSTDGMVVDAVEQTAYVIDKEFVDGVETGRTYRKVGGHLLSSLDYGPLEWPVLDCSEGYLMVVELFDPVDYGYIDVRIAVRE